MYTYIHIHVYIYIYREREIHVCIYIYISYMLCIASLYIFCRVVRTENAMCCWKTPPKGVPVKGVPEYKVAKCINMYRFRAFARACAYLLTALSDSKTAAPREVQQEAGTRASEGGTQNLNALPPPAPFLKLKLKNQLKNKLMIKLKSKLIHNLKNKLINEQIKPQTNERTREQIRHRANEQTNE